MSYCLSLNSLVHNKYCFRVELRKAGSIAANRKDHKPDKNKKQTKKNLVLSGTKEKICDL